MTVSIVDPTPARAPGIPSVEQCLELHDRYEMLDNIRAHSFVVARVAETVLDGLVRSAKDIRPLPDRDLVIAGALLHDIAKTLCLKTDCRHAEIGQKICVDLGYPELGEIVAEHVYLKAFAPTRYVQGLFRAKEMVYYADKRVCHDQVVSLDARLDYILKRYAVNNPARERLIRENFTQTQDFERYLFCFLDFRPEELDRHIIHAPWGTTA